MNPIAVSDLSLIATGSARGIGAATVRLLAGHGAKVLVTDVLDAEGEALAAEFGDNVVYRRLDVTAPDEWTAAVAAAEKAFGSVNALFNNAGIATFSGVLQHTPESFRKIVDINLYGVFLGIHATAPAIAKAGGGTIINTSSTAGMQGYAGIAGYVASKWGVRGLTKAAALDLAADNIRVLSLHPGPIRTPMTEGLPEENVAAQPISRFGEPDEVARMVRFMLCEATFSTGSEFLVDGGAVTGQVLEMPEE